MVNLTLFRNNPNRVVPIKIILVEVGTAKPGKLAVYERDVALTVLYGIPCIILLRHQPGTNRSTGAASVYVYTVHKYVFYSH